MENLSDFYNFDEKRVLIVEDEAILALGMECSLEEFGYEVSGIETTANGAIEHVKDNKPDVILMDINLRGEASGIDAAKEIWNSSKTPVIFLTSYSDDKTVKRAMLSEPYGYLIKPCRDKELKVAIQTALHKHNYFYKNKETLKSVEKNNSRIKCPHNIVYDKAKRVLYKEDEIIKLTGNELKLFDILTDYINESVSYERINSFIWRVEDSSIGRLRSLVYRIKTKIGVNIIENIFEMGYKLKVQ